ncbi:unnamed protein product [Nippostrongylus brasiliensis]|uniref:NADH dehydrogenase [ubiquinone] flavoprotein 3, mitochondrial n=1 Tax=Nippostrongylus brasiliensis TaxID=27835 RepID=A0A0N4Y381_NIPBR|nr:unnamed protein product [Nippostrongylus brasiliensis]
MNRVGIARIVSRRLSSAAPKYPTGIEHADAALKAGGGKPDRKLYKVGVEYLNMNKYSFSDSEAAMLKFRLQQPTTKQPDVLPKVKIQ